MLREKVEGFGEGSFVVFTTKVLRVVLVLRALFMGNESATKPTST